MLNIIYRFNSCIQIILTKRLRVKKRKKLDVEN
jgi:hypothetical protein